MSDIETGSYRLTQDLKRALFPSHLHERLDTGEVTVASGETVDLPPGTEVRLLNRDPNNIALFEITRIPPGDGEPDESTEQFIGRRFPSSPRTQELFEPIERENSE